MSVLNNCRQEVYEFLKDINQFVRFHTSQINSEHRERWNVIRVNGERQFDLRNEVVPDYSFFLVNKQSEILGMESFKSLFSKAQADNRISGSLRLSGLSDESFFIYYVVPISAILLARVDENHNWDGSQSLLIDQLDQFLTKDTITARISFAYKNFTSDVVDVELADGMFLRSLPDEILESHINSIGRSTGLIGVMRLKETNFCLEVVVEQPRTGVRPFATGAQFQAKSEDLLRALRLIKSGAVGYSYVAGEIVEPMGFNGIWMSGPDTQVLYGAEYEFHATDIPNVQEMLVGLELLAPDNRFSLALGRLMETYRKPIGGDRLVDSWIALEALLLPTEKDELRFRAALRGAWFIGESSEERAKIFDDLKRSYDYRSAVVHGSEKAVPEKVVMETEAYLRHALRKCVELGSAPTATFLNSLVVAGN